MTIHLLEVNRMIFGAMGERERERERQRENAKLSRTRKDDEEDVFKRSAQQH